MGHRYSHLTKDERQTIFRLLERKVPVTQIARIVGRHASTLYREVRRNHSRQDIDAAETALGFVLPEDFKAFMLANGAGEGFVGMPRSPRLSALTIFNWLPDGACLMSRRSRRHLRAAGFFIPASEDEEPDALKVRRPCASDIQCKFGRARALESSLTPWSPSNVRQGSPETPSQSC